MTVSVAGSDQGVAEMSSDEEKAKDATTSLPDTGALLDHRQHDFDATPALQ